MPRFGTDPILTGRDDPSLLTVPLGDALRATVGETIATSPTPSLYRAGEVETAEEGIRQEGSTLGRIGYVPEFNRAPETPQLSKAQAEAKIDAAGLTGRLAIPESGIRQGALDLLIEYKDAESRRQFTLDRYRGGVAGGAAQLTTALATSLVDPINIASAFVPVVGEGRYAALLGRAGQSMVARAGARAGVGAIEGTVGAAVLEPLIYGAQQQIQADYDAVDSLLNIGFGAVFGSVVQPGAGLISDVLARRAGMGAWAETITPDLQRFEAPIPEGWVAGGGTRFVDGDDYVSGQWAVADAAALRSDAAPFAAGDAGQLGASPWADSGAPVVRSGDGTILAGNRRMATVLNDYAGGRGDGYRAEVLDQAQRYGLDSEQVSAMAQPVLMRVAGKRDAGAWGEYRKIAEASPEARAQRAVDAGQAPVARPLQGEQRQAAMGVAVAQAVNGGRVDVGAVTALDGTPAGVQRFLESRRLAEQAEVAVRDASVADIDRLRAETEQFTPEQAAKLDQDVAALETSLREQVRAAGGDEADIDAALAEIADVVAETDAEAKALRGVALCMLRAA